MSSKPAEPRPFERLGALLESWRKKRFRSAAAMHRSLKLPCSYSAYVEYERGISLIPIDLLVGVAGTLEEEAAPAARLWAELQMPTDELRQLFREDRTREVPYPRSDTDLSIQDRWIFGKAERDFLADFPWFFELCLKLVLAYPNEVSFSELGFESPSHAGRFIEAYLRPWVQLKRLKVSSSGILASEPHVLIPNTPDWADVRARNFLTAYQSLGPGITAEAIRRRSACRELTTRSLLPEQVSAWISRLSEVNREFNQLNGADNPSSLTNQPHSMLIAFGPRRLGIPKSVLDQCR